MPCRAASSLRAPFLLPRGGERIVRSSEAIAEGVLRWREPASTLRPPSQLCIYDQGHELEYTRLKSQCTVALRVVWIRPYRRGKIALLHMALRVSSSVISAEK